MKLFTFHLQRKQYRHDKMYNTHTHTQKKHETNEEKKTKIAQMNRTAVLIAREKKSQFDWRGNHKQIELTAKYIYILTKYRGISPAHRILFT